MYDLCKISSLRNDVRWLVDLKQPKTMISLHDDRAAVVVVQQTNILFLSYLDNVGAGMIWDQCQKVLKPCNGTIEPTKLWRSAIISQNGLKLRN